MHAKRARRPAARASRDQKTQKRDQKSRVTACVKVCPTIFNTKSEDRQISFCYNIGMWSFVGIISISDDSVELDDETDFW